MFEKAQFGEKQKEPSEKSELRKRLSLIRSGVADKPALSRVICEKALSLVSGNVMTYVSFGSEVDTSRLIASLLGRADVTLFAPYTADGIIIPRRLCALGKPDRLGNLPESSYCDNLEQTRIKTDFCITPLLGFNRNGYRIGYGKGCYDRFFAAHETYAIGLSFSAQMINFSPEFNDIPLDCCVTEKDVIYF